MHWFKRNSRQPFKFYYTPGSHPAPSKLVTLEEYAARHPNLVWKSFATPAPLRTACFPLERVGGPFDMARVKLVGKTQEYHFHAPFIACLLNGRLIEGDGVALTSENELLAKTSLPHFGRQDEEHRLFQHLTLPSPRWIDQTVAVIATASAACYFHWMLNALPRLDLIKRSGIAYDYLYLPELCSPYQWESLQNLKIDFDRSIIGGKGLHLQARQVIVPSLPAGQADCPPWVVDFLRNHFLPAEIPTAHRKLYIGRQGARRRLILNEEELLAALKRRGFERVDLEYLSLIEQVKLLASASTVVAPHGAGLTNLIFCQPQTSVLEIHHPDWVCDCYWQVSAHLKLRHYLATAERAQRKQWKKLSCDGQDPLDMTVDVPKLMQQLDRIGR